MIVEALRMSTKGLTYSTIRESIGLSDTGLSNFLRRLEYFGLILKDEEGLYHITTIGLQFLMNMNPLQISENELRARRKKEFIILWQDLRLLHEKFLRVREPHLVKTLLGAKTGPGFYVGALRDAKGRKILSLRTTDLRERERLGYSHKRPVSETS